jgi:branched-chain amino acid transport system ATP-binding protein
VEDLVVGYGQSAVLHGVSLTAAAGQKVAVLGPNGAGKSTLLRTISGLLKPRGGSITLDGERIAGLDPARIVALGVAHVPEGRQVFPEFTVRENLRVAAYTRGGAGLDEAMERVLTLFPSLRQHLNTPAGLLSGGEQQMVALGRAIIQRPRVVLIDELSLGLAPRVVEELLQIVERIHSSGVTVVLVEQSVNIALELASRAYFLEKGEVRFEGRSEDLADREDLVRSVFLAGAR